MDLQREHRYSRCLKVSRSSFSVMASRSARPRLRAANMDLWVITGLPSAVPWDSNAGGRSRISLVAKCWDVVL